MWTTSSCICQVVDFPLITPNKYSWRLWSIHRIATFWHVLALGLIFKKTDLLAAFRACKFLFSCTETNGDSFHSPRLKLQKRSPAKFTWWINENISRRWVSEYVNTTQGGTATIEKHRRCPMSPPQMYLARIQWKALQMITATLSTLSHSLSFWSGWPFLPRLTWWFKRRPCLYLKTPSSTWLTPRALLPPAHKI